MKRSEARDWLEKLRDDEMKDSVPADCDKTWKDKDIDWIMEALALTSCSIDEKKMPAVAGIEPSLTDILQVVAYGLPGLPLALRKKKRRLNTRDVHEFFFLKDDKWEKYRTNHNGIGEFAKYLFPEPRSGDN